jgi:hypothetical protein
MHPRPTLSTGRPRFTRCHTRLAGTAALAILLLCGAHARTWTSSDGSKTFEGELKSYDPDTGAVGVTLANGKSLNFRQDKLSEADIAFLKEQGKVAAPGSAPAKTAGVLAAEGKAVDMTQPADMTKPVQVFILLGQSNMVGLGKINGGEGSLETAVKTKKLYPYLLNEAGEWSERKDVRNVRVMVGKGKPMDLFNNEWMTVPGSKTMGPEFGIGHPLGDAIEAPVMILKSCIGNRSLGWDLLPPGSEPYEHGGKLQPGYRGTEADPKGNGEKPEGTWYAGKQYDDDIANAKAVLSDLNTYYPDAKKYEVAGFFFWQGEKDGGNPAHAERYEQNLVAFIKQLRKDFESPDARFVLATLGEATKGSGGNGGKILDAQLAVDGKDGKHPEFKGNVATVYSNPLSKGGSGNSHYGGNAETYMNVGEAMGKAMVELLKN